TYRRRAFRQSEFSYFELECSVMFGHKKTPSNWNVQLLGVTSDLQGFFITKTMLYLINEQ
ncbi:hypothetical protein AAEU31_02435, partial [Pseudoalteromonas sp. SSMSWG5]|uniref:hypothetical protein n=1 Tax=Pseudoalteromonas sp. SSMSWG5 TaxID=3139396 RepID=UPI003BA91215